MNILPDYIKGERVQLCRSLPSHAGAVWQFGWKKIGQVLCKNVL